MPRLVRGIHVFLAAIENVDPRDKPGGDDHGQSASGWRLSSAVSKREPDSRGTSPRMTILASSDRPEKCHLMTTLKVGIASYEG